MVKYFVGLNGFCFKWRGKEYSLAWMKAGPKFYAFVVLAVGVPTVLFHVYNPQYEWIPIIPAAMFVGAFEFLKYYSMKYPLTMEEANEIEKQGYDKK